MDQDGPAPVATFTAAWHVGRLVPEADEQV